MAKTPSTDLRISETATLPLDAATRRLALLATSGAGKSNAAVVMAEEMTCQGVPWYAVDPKGDWWGVRSSADGKSAGLSVPIFGGLHGDIPIEPTAGKMLAETISRQRLSSVLDVSQFESRQKMYGFLADFATELLRRNTEPLHGFLDECHQYIPQTGRDRGEQMRCLGAWERLITGGRNKGLGTTQISQRTALVNKNTLDIAECIIALRTFSPRDIEAIEGWLKSRADKTLTDTILTSLPLLKNGEAWRYAPEWLPGPPERVQFRRRWTFDSAATPEVGKSVTPPSTLADIDLAALGARMAEAVERVQADDPKVLRARIATLERDIAHGGVQADAQVVAGYEAQAVELRRERDEAEARYNREHDDMLEALRIANILRDTTEELRAIWPEDASPVRPVHQGPARIVRPIRTTEVAPHAPLHVDVATEPDHAVITGGPLAKAERAVLTALAQYPQGRTVSQIALLTGYRQSGGFRNTLSSLRTSGCMEGTNGAIMSITPVGLAILGPFEPLPTGHALLDFWLNDKRLGKAHRAVLQAAYDAYPEALSANEAARLTDYTVSGGFRNVLSYLRTSELIVGPNGGFTASPLFFEGAAR